MTEEPERMYNKDANRQGLMALTGKYIILDGVPRLVQKVEMKVTKHGGLSILVDTTGPK